MLPNHSGLYYSAILRDIGLSIINIFIPIYVYHQVHSFPLTFFLFSLHHLATVLFAYPTAKMVNRLGVDLSGFIGGVLHSLFFFLLVLGRSQPLFFVPAMLAWGLSIPFTWLPHNYYLTSGEDPQMGRRMAILSFVNRWLSAIAPLLGGILLNLGGFNLVYLLAIIIIGLSGLPLFCDCYNYQPEILSFRKVWQEFLQSDRRMSLALFASGIESYLLAYVWPLYLYLIVQSYVKVGLVQAGSLLIASLILIWQAKAVDAGRKSILFRPALALNALNFFVRGFIVSVWPLFILETVYRLGSIFVWMPFDARIYAASREEKRMEFFIRREWLIHSGGLVACLAMVLLFSLWTNWSWTFALGALSLLLIGTIRI